jgi:copper chaperone CopZ
MTTDTYTVDDIHCGGCERMIRTLVGDVAGVQQVEPDHRTNQVVVTYDESLVDDSTVREALTNAGFRPK